MTTEGGGLLPDVTDDADKIAKAIEQNGDEVFEIIHAVGTPPSHYGQYNHGQPASDGSGVNSVMSHFILFVEDFCIIIIYIIRLKLRFRRILDIIYGSLWRCSRARL